MIVLDHLQILDVRDTLSIRRPSIKSSPRMTLRSQLRISAQIKVYDKSKGVTVGAEDYSFLLNGPKLASPTLGPLGVSHLRVHPHDPDHKASYYPQIASRPQRYPILRSSLSAIGHTMERIRNLESAVRQVNPVTGWFCLSLIDCGSGPLLYMSIAGQKILVLNTNKVAADPLDRRGTIYSDRPRFISKSCHQCLQHSAPTQSLRSGGGQDIYRWIDVILCEIQWTVRTGFLCLCSRVTSVLMEQAVGVECVALPTRH